MLNVRKKEAYRFNNKYVDWMKAYKGQRDPKEHMVNGIEKGRSRGHCKIHLMRGVMIYMCCPEEPDLVADSVKPIVDQLVENKKYKNGQYGSLNLKRAKII